MLLVAVVLAPLPAQAEILLSMFPFLLANGFWKKTENGKLLLDTSFFKGQPKTRLLREKEEGEIQEAENKANRPVTGSGGKEETARGRERRVSQKLRDCAEAIKCGQKAALGTWGRASSVEWNVKEAQQEKCVCGGGKLGRNHRTSSGSHRYVPKTSGQTNATLSDARTRSRVEATEKEDGWRCGGPRKNARGWCRG